MNISKHRQIASKHQHRPLRQQSVETGRETGQVEEATDQVTISSTSPLSDDKLAPHRPGQVLLKLPPEDELSQSEADDLFKEFNFASGRQLRMSSQLTQKCGGRYFLAELPNTRSVAESVQELQSDQRVLSAQPNYIVTRDQVVIDSDKGGTTDDDYTPPEDAPIDLRPTQWNLHNEGQTGGLPGAHVSALDAWRESKGAGVTIALMDTGVDLENADLQPNLWVNEGEIPGDGIDNDGNGYVDDVHGINLVDRAAPPDDDNGHGTFNATVIGAVEGNNEEGLVGLAPQSKMMSIKFMEASGRGDIAAAIEGISYAEAHGARIVLNGWMSRTQNQSLFEVIEASEALHVCSAGNDGYDNDLRPVHPASFPLSNVVTVAATDHHDDFTRFTNRGPNSVDLAAPGRKVVVYERDGDLARRGGASIAAAHVAAAGALIVSKFPNIDNESLATRLIYNGDKMPEDADRIKSGKRLNAAAALRNDTTPPAAPGDFSVSAVEGSRLRFDFQTVSDDGDISKEPVAFYEARISSRPIVPDGQQDEESIAFSAATPVPLKLDQEMVPGKRVSTEFAVGASGNERQFHLAIRATDKVGNHSELSNADVTVPPSNVIFEEGFELEPGAEDRWTLEGKWARVPMPGRGTIMTDSPDGDYDNNYDASLVSPTIDLRNVSRAKLNFDARYTIEPDHDACEVEIYTDGWWGKTWKTIATLDGYSDWSNHEIDISKYTGDEVKIRFRMDTDRDRVAYGVQLDHLSIATEN